MVVVDVRTDTPRDGVAQGFVRHDECVCGRVDRTKRAFGDVEGLEVVFFKKYDAGNRTVGFDGIEFTVARHAEEHEATFGSLARHSLDGIVLGDVERLRQIGDGAQLRCVHLLHGYRSSDRRASRDHGLRGFDVRRPSAVTVDQLGFSVHGKRHELGRDLAADLSGVCFDGAVLESKALADATIGTGHRVVMILQRFLCGVEAVCVLHDELTAAQ